MWNNYSPHRRPERPCPPLEEGNTEIYTVRVPMHKRLSSPHIPKNFAGPKHSIWQEKVLSQVENLSVQVPEVDLTLGGREPKHYQKVRRKAIWGKT